MKKIAYGMMAAIVLSGCATNKSLYSWGDYEGQVYSHFKGESPEQQILILEKQLVEIKSKGEVPPPGFYAHLGLLYEKAGKGGDVMAMFEEEKRIYPESTIFLTNISNGFKAKDEKKN